MYNEDRAACRIAYLSTRTDRERKRERTRERERAEGTHRSQKRSAPPKGAGSPINSLRAATAKCSLYAEIMKITNSPAAYVRARTTCHGPRFESTPSKLSPTRVDQAAPSTYIYIYNIGNCRPLYFVGGEEWQEASHRVEYIPSADK